MRERAEAKFQKDVIGRVEYEREALEIKTEKQRKTLLWRIKTSYK